jgi:hypothetical protein
MHGRRLLIGLFAVVALALTGCGGGNLNLGDLGKLTLKPCALPTTLPVTTKVSVDCTAIIKPPKTTTTTSTTTTTTGPTTTTTVPVTTTTLTTTTTATTPPLDGRWPTMANTGYPAGTSFITVAGDTHVTTPGQLIDGWHVTGDLLIDVPGVTVRNSWIEGYLDNSGVPHLDSQGNPPARMTVQDTTIGDTGLNTCNGQPGVGEHDYTATRVKIVNHGDGFRGSGSNVTIADSFVQVCDHMDNHDDALQIYCPMDSSPQLPNPCQNYDVHHNTLIVVNIRNFTSPLFGGSDPNGNVGNGFLANSTFSDNLLWGGVAEIFLYGDGLKIDHNRLMVNEWHNPAPDPGDPNHGDYHGSAFATLRDSGLYRPVVDSFFYGNGERSWTDNLEVIGDISAGTATLFSSTEVQQD